MTGDFSKLEDFTYRRLEQRCTVPRLLAMVWRHVG
jgi:hypothetical protein